MRTTPEKGGRSDDANRTVRNGFARGLLALVVVGLCLAIWPRSKTPPHTAEQIPSALAQSGSQPHPDRYSDVGSRVSSWELDPDSPAATKKRHFEELWAAFLAAQALEDPIERNAALNRCMKSLTPEVAANLLAWLKPADLKGDIAQRLFDHWATGKPDVAAAWAQGQDDPESRQAFLNVAALRWAATDLSKAANWARNLPEGNSRFEIMAAVGSEAVRSDPLEALRLGVELPAGAAQTELIRRAAAEWAGKDRDSAMEWAEQIEDKELRLRVTEQIVVASAEQDPMGAATIALQQMSPGEEQGRAVVSIVQRWVQTDPGVASAWVSGFPESALGRDAVDNLVNLWANRDLVASGNWLLTLRKGELRNAGILAYSRVLGRTDAELAQRWALSVTAGQ